MSDGDSLLPMNIEGGMTTNQPTNIPAPSEICTARTRAGRQCHMPVVAPGYPFCYLHIKNGEAVVHDRYSNAMPTNLEAAHQHQLADNAPKDLTQEIANTRALLRTFYDDFKTNGKPMTPDDIQLVLQMIESVGRSVERQSKLHPDRIITVPEVMSIITKIIDIINAKLPLDQLQVREDILREMKTVISDMQSTSQEFVYGQTK